MSSVPVFGYKTSTTAGVTEAKSPTGGKANTLPTGDATPTSSYVDKLATLGGAKPQPTEGSGDKVTDILNTLDQVSKKGVPDGLDPKYTKLTAEDVLSKFSDSPEYALTKYNSVISTLQKKINDANAGIAAGGGSVQQIQAAQQLKAQLEDLLNFYTIQRDKVAMYAPQKELFWKQELEDFFTVGIGKPPNPNFAKMADKDGDGHIGKPGAPGSYKIGVRTFSKSYDDPVAKKLGLPFHFKPGEKQYWVVNSETKKRVDFDPVTGKVVKENSGNPDYLTKPGYGFGDLDNDTIIPNEYGEIVLHTGADTNPANFMESGLVLQASEFIWVEVDSDGNMETPPKVAPFQLKDGTLTQAKPNLEGSTHYKQVFIKKLNVSSNTDGDIEARYEGIDPVDGTSKDIMTLQIKGKDKDHKATSVALGIVSGEGPSHRETPVIINAGSYASTCRKGLTKAESFDPLHKFQFSNNKATGPQAAQINDTLKNFVAKDDTGEIDSPMNRGISMKGSGHFIGADNVNNYYEVEEPPSYLTNADDEYRTVIEGGANGHNALIADGKGSLDANGLTFVSKDSGDAVDDVRIGVNRWAKIKNEKTGGLQVAKGKISNKLYIDVASEKGIIAFQSTPDGVEKNDPNATKNSENPGWDAGNDYYSLSAETVAISSIDNTTASGFDPDLSKPGVIKGHQVACSATDFVMDGQNKFSEDTKKLEESIGKKATDSGDYDWEMDGTTQEWMNAKYYQEVEKEMDSFFGGFNASKGESEDLFADEIDKEKKSGGIL